MTNTTLTDQLAPLAARYADLTTQIDNLTQARDMVKAQIRDLTAATGPDTYAAGNLTVAVQTNRRFDPAAFSAKYPAHAFPQFYELTPSVKNVRAGLAPNVVDQFMGVVGDPKVVIR